MTPQMSTARARRTPHGQDSLMEIAVGEFITRGYDATSMEDLSRAAGITKSSFYHHFASKEALLRAALDRSLAGLFALLDEPGATTGNPLDKTTPITPGIKTKALLGAQATTPRAIARPGTVLVPVAGPLDLTTVEVIRGDKRAREVVRQEPSRLADG